MIKHELLFKFHNAILSLGSFGFQNSRVTQFAISIKFYSILVHLNIKFVINSKRALDVRDHSPSRCCSLRKAISLQCSYIVNILTQPLHGASACVSFSTTYYLLSLPRVREVQRRPPPCIHVSAAVAGAVSACLETRKSNESERLGRHRQLTRRVI